MIATAARFDEMVKNIFHYKTNLLLTLRYFLNPIYSIKPITLRPINCSPPIHPLDSSTGSSPDCSLPPPIRIFPNSIVGSKFYSSRRYPVSPSNLGSLRPQCLLRRFFVSSSNRNLHSTSPETVISDKIVNQVIEFIRIGGDDCGSKLNSIGLVLSTKSVFEIFQHLNSERVPGLSFYNWVRDRKPNLSYNTHVCSLIIDNCGRVGDDVTMISLLKEFTGKRICLTDKAFGFLADLVSSDSAVVESVRALAEVLIEVGGSCRGSGICAMVNMLCTLDSFQMAKFVIEITDRNVSYYNILMRVMCSRHYFEEARGLLVEMRGLGCELKADTYNYLLGSLCKSYRISEASSLLEEMQGNGTPPDAITFEIFIYYCCRIGKLDAANQFYSQMISRGLEARITTHKAILEGYFEAGEIEEAHKYVNAVGVGVQSSYMVYSLLAKLHHRKGNIDVARRVLMDMMDKGLKPYHPICMNIVKRLKMTGNSHLALDLKKEFSRFYVEPRTKTG